MSTDGGKGSPDEAADNPREEDKNRHHAQNAREAEDELAEADQRVTSHAAVRWR